MTAPAIESVLDNDQVDHYFREGYVLAPQLVSHATIDRAVAAAPANAGEGDFWRPVIFDHNQPTKDDPIHRLLIEPTVVAAVEQLFEAPARVYYGMMAVVPAHGGRGLPWHQDNMYSAIFGHALNTFIALDDITPDMAILWVSPKSHHMGVQASHAADTHHGHREADVEPENGIALPAMKKGDACIFNRSTLHRSLSNTTDRPRFAYAAQYMEEKARMMETGQRDPMRMLTSDLAATLGNPA